MKTYPCDTNSNGFCPYISGQFDRVSCFEKCGYEDESEEYYGSLEDEYLQIPCDEFEDSFNSF